MQNSNDSQTPKKRLRPLVITDETRQKVAAIREFSVMNPVPYREAIDLLDGSRLQDVFDPRRLCKVDWGYECGFQVISLPDNSEGYQLTIQTEAPEVVPGSVVLEALMCLFGLGALPADLVYGERGASGGVLHIFRRFRLDLVEIPLLEDEQ